MPRNELDGSKRDGVPVTVVVHERRCEICDAIAIRIYKGQQFVPVEHVKVKEQTVIVCRKCSDDLLGVVTVMPSGVFL
jgi:hypothetical protein